MPSRKKAGDKSKMCKLNPKLVCDTLSRLLSEQYDAKIEIKLVKKAKEEI